MAKLAGHGSRSPREDPAQRELVEIVKARAAARRRWTRRLLILLIVVAVVVVLNRLAVHVTG